MAEKATKAARAVDKAALSAKACPKCSTPMVATKVIKTPERAGGMYWICPKDEHRQKV